MTVWLQTSGVRVSDSNITERKINKMCRGERLGRGGQKDKGQEQDQESGRDGRRRWEREDTAMDSVNGEQAKAIGMAHQGVEPAAASAKPLISE